MQLKTSLGYTYTVDWIDTVSTSGNVFMQMADARALPEIAAEFDGLEWLKREDADQGNKTFEGYSVLIGIQRVEPDIVIMTLKKAGDN